MIKKCIFSVALIFLSGCATLGPKFEGVSKSAPSDRVFLYVYRPKVFSGAMRSPDIFANGVKIGTLSNGSYFVSAVNPGDNLLQFGDTLGSKSVGLKAIFKPGQTYFFRVDLSLRMFDHPTHPDATQTQERCPSGHNDLLFKSSISDEVKKLIADMDTRVHKEVCYPGLLFVTKEHAEEEMKSTGLSSP